MLIDAFQRKIDYLRVSVTERCNFRCSYCMPDKPFNWTPHENILRYEELFDFIKYGIDHGIKKIRLTGGEPTVRANLDQFIKMIADYAPDIDLALTTNGYLLGDLAPLLAQAGLKRVNISLDSLTPHIAEKIAGKDVLSHVLTGIDAALASGLHVKLNCVPLKGINDHELISLINFSKEKGVTIRFIEYMENHYANVLQGGLTSQEICQTISSSYLFTPQEKSLQSPAQYYRLEDGYEFGIIEPHKEDFCQTCNRLRLSAEGFLIPCLYFDEALSIKDALKSHDMKELDLLTHHVLRHKPEKNRWNSQNLEVSNRAFYHTGG